MTSRSAEQHGPGDEQTCDLQDAVAALGWLKPSVLDSSLSPHFSCRLPLSNAPQFSHFMTTGNRWAYGCQYPEGRFQVSFLFPDNIAVRMPGDRVE